MMGMLMIDSFMTKEEARSYISRKQHKHISKMFVKHEPDFDRDYPYIVYKKN